MAKLMAHGAAWAATLLAKIWETRLGARKHPVQALPAEGQAVSAVPAPARTCDSQLLNHEMRNYLCAIRGNAHLLRQKAKAPDQAAILDRIDRAIERLEGFAARGQEVPDVVAPRIREWIDPVQAARASSLTYMESGRAEFSFNASEGLPYIQGDPHRLEQVFINLYGNALEAGADRVRILFRRLGDELEIAVEDNGRGCCPASVARLFDPSFSTKTAPAGPCPPRGLGLFIVRSIVESHGGRIRAATKNGRRDGETGLVVRMCFPAPPSRESRSDASRENRSKTPRETRTPPVREARTALLPERLPIAAGI